MVVERASFREREVIAPTLAGGSAFVEGTAIAAVLLERRAVICRVGRVDSRCDPHAMRRIVYEVDRGTYGDIERLGRKAGVGVGHGDGGDHLRSCAGRIDGWIGIRSLKRCGRVASFKSRVGYGSLGFMNKQEIATPDHEDGDDNGESDFHTCS